VLFCVLFFGPPCTYVALGAQSTQGQTKHERPKGQGHDLQGQEQIDKGFDSCSKMGYYRKITRLKSGRQHEKVR